MTGQKRVAERRSEGKEPGARLRADRKGRRRWQKPLLADVSGGRLQAQWDV